MVPSLFETSRAQYTGLPSDLSVHDSPKSVDVHKRPLLSKASFVPSLLETILSRYKVPQERAFGVSPTDRCIHDWPESVDVQILTFISTSQNRSPFGSVQSLRPVTVWERAVTASFVPSLLEAISLISVTPSPGHGALSLSRPVGALESNAPTGLSVHDCPESADVQTVPLERPKGLRPGSWVAASLVPSLLETILFHGFFAPTDLSVQDCPESSDVQMVPRPHGSKSPKLKHSPCHPSPGKHGEQSIVADSTAASFVPSLLEAMSSESFGAPPTDLSVHERPESQDVQILPSHTPAASFAPSLLDAIATQF